MPGDQLVVEGVVVGDEDRAVLRREGLRVERSRAARTRSGAFIVYVRRAQEKDRRYVANLNPATEK